MARQLRLVIPALAHLIQLRALPGIDPYPSEDDRQRFLATLREATHGLQVQLNAFALLPDRVLALATPGDRDSLGRWLQAVGRLYVSAYNRRHGRSGTLWAGRFRSAAVEPGAWTLRALRYVDAAAGAVSTSAGQRSGGGPRDWPVTDPPEYWALGNTPFERETVYAARLAEPLSEPEVVRLERCLSGGWVCGDDPFVHRLAPSTARAPVPRPRGRPPRTTTAH